MVNSAQCTAKYGAATPNNKNLVLWDVPTQLEIGVIPKKIFCNHDMVEPLQKAFENLIARNHVAELKTWDGCFNIRQKRGLNTMSLHSWGIAVDINAFENGLGAVPKLSAGFVQCFIDAGFDWGGTWQRKDGMHFQLAKI